jgi:hypothetical protein
MAGANHQTTVLVTVDDAHLPRLSEITENLKHAGVTVLGSLPKLGIIRGSVASEKMGSLAKLKGVESVRPEEMMYPAGAKGSQR